MANDPSADTKKREEEAKKRQEEEQKRREEAQRKEQGRQQQQPVGLAARPVSNSPSSQGSRPGGTTVHTTSPMKGEPLPNFDPRGDTFLTKDEIKSIAGDIEPGEFGWVKLDDEGSPTGAASREPPPNPAEEPVARVVGAPQKAYDEVVTPSGAPVTRFMNPEPAMWDEGMLVRNPPPPKTEEQTKWRHTPGAPVINQPVTT